MSERACYMARQTVDVPLKESSQGSCVHVVVRVTLVSGILALLVLLAHNVSENASTISRSEVFEIQNRRLIGLVYRMTHGSLERYVGSTANPYSVRPAFVPSSGWASGTRQGKGVVTSDLEAAVPVTRDAIDIRGALFPASGVRQQESSSDNGEAAWPTGDLPQGYFMTTDIFVLEGAAALVKGASGTCAARGYMGASVANDTHPVEFAAELVCRTVTLGVAGSGYTVDDVVCRMILSERYRLDQYRLVDFAVPGGCAIHRERSARSSEMLTSIATNWPASLASRSATAVYGIDLRGRVQKREPGAESPWAPAPEAASMVYARLSAGRDVVCALGVKNPESVLGHISNFNTGFGGIREFGFRDYGGDGASVSSSASIDDRPVGSVECIVTQGGSQKFEKLKEIGDNAVAVAAKNRTNVYYIHQAGGVFMFQLPEGPGGPNVESRVAPSTVSGGRLSLVDIYTSPGDTKGDLYAIDSLGRAWLWREHQNGPQRIWAPLPELVDVASLAFGPDGTLYAVNFIGAVMQHNPLSNSVTARPTNVGRAMDRVAFTKNNVGVGLVGLNPVDFTLDPI